VESKVEGFIKTKELKVASTSKEKWKKCVKNCVMAVYPTLKTTEEIAGVGNL
jgi:hypothetical protein